MKLRGATIFVILIMMISHLSIFIDNVEGKEGPPAAQGSFQTSLISFAGGNGTKDDPYQISNVSQLQKMNENLSAHYELVNDINATETYYWNDGKGFEPIGRGYYINDFKWQWESFHGSLNGNNNSIDYLYINRTERDFVGLFGSLGKNSIIKNICINKYSILGRLHVGSISGRNEGLVININSYVDNYLSGISNIGGITGNNFGCIKECSIRSLINGQNNIGGITSFNFGSVSDCFYIGKIIGISCIGGISGLNRGFINSSHTDGHLISEYSSSVSLDGRVGGIVGKMIDGLIRDSYSECNITGNNYCSGLIGKFDSYNNFVINSYYSINRSKINGRYIPSYFGIFEYQYKIWKKNNLTLDIDGFLDKNSKGSYNISNAIDIKLMLAFSGYKEYCFIQTKNIDLSNNINLFIPFFNSKLYNGNNRSIYNITIKGNIDRGGFFGFVNRDSKINDLTLYDININISYMGFVGSFAGENTGKILNCSTYGKVRGYYVIGGLIGRNKGTIYDSLFSGEIYYNKSNKYKIVGGLVGSDTGGDVYNSYYNIDKTLINNKEYITQYGIYNIQYNDWLSNNRKLNINNYFNNTKDYYIINSFKDMKRVLPFTLNSSIKFLQKNNIDLSNKEFYIPIFNAKEYNGNNKTIFNFTQKNIDIINSYGFFGKINKYSKIINMKFINCSIKGSNHVGIISGICYGSISNCTVHGKVQGNAMVGLVAGRCNNIKNVKSFGNVIGEGNSIGGISGYSYGNSNGLYFFGNVTGYQMVGGLFGLKIGSLLDSHSEAIIEGYYRVGGLLGQIEGAKNSSTVINCKSKGIVKGKMNIGGLIGRNTQQFINQCSSECYVNATRERIGGLIGENNGPVSNSFAKGNVKGKQWVGGLLGTNSNLVKNCYSTGKVSLINDGLNDVIGGLIGSNSGNVYNSFWDNITSKQKTSEGGIGKNTTEMMRRNTYLSSGWDFENIWNIIDNQTYPFLRSLDKPPKLLYDNTPNEVEFGHNLTFNISITDDYGLDIVYIEYWYNKEIIHNRGNMSFNGINYIYTVKVPPQNVSYLNYIIHGKDVTNNSIKSEVNMISIVDINPPSFIIDNTPSNGTTGDILNFNISVIDDNYLDSVHVEYWFGSGNHSNISMNNNGSYFEINITRL